jgi:translation elongation factor EF-G
MSAKAASKKKPAKKAAKKKAKKTPATRKVSAKKRAKKKSAKTTVKKRTSSGTGAKKKAAGKKASVRSASIPEKTFSIEPGPPSQVAPPVEEPALNEKAIGTITHYYSHLNVAVVQINTGTLRSGDMIRIKGHSTDFTQMIESMEYEHQHIDEAEAGQTVGLKTKDHARQHDTVYLVK